MLFIDSNQLDKPKHVCVQEIVEKGIYLYSGFDKSCRRSVLDSSNF